MEEPSPDIAASLDCCDHVYCFLCIHQWVNSGDSKCPQCKKEISVIRHKDREGKEASFNVESRHQNMLTYDCTECRQRIRGANLVTGSGADEAVVCDDCEEYACHIRCLTEQDAQFFELNDCWLCGLCAVILDSYDI